MQPVARLGELIYLQTGMPNNGFFKAASLMAGEDRESGLKASINLLGGVTSTMRFGSNMRTDSVR